MNLKIANDLRSLILSNPQGKEIQFTLTDNSIHLAILHYLRWSKCNSDVKTVMYSPQQKYLVFSTGYTIKLSDSAHYEISNRMVLLNDKLTCSEINDVPSLEEGQSNA